MMSTITPITSKQLTALALIAVARVHPLRSYLLASGGCVTLFVRPATKMVGVEEQLSRTRTKDKGKRGKHAFLYCSHHSLEA